MTSLGSFSLGSEVLQRCGHPWLNRARIGLLANHASVNRDLIHTWRVMDGAYPGSIKALFTPQHGFWADAQANMIETDHGWHAPLNVPIFSLYSETRQPTSRMLETIDCLVVDLQDVGTRIYTFVWTMLECMRACARANVRMLILDRPNPLGGRVIEGPLLGESFTSFVGGSTIPMRHGLTIAELARLLHHEQALDLEMDVIPMQGWHREWFWEDCDRLWIPPSPNLPSMQSTRIYPGQVLLEGTNLSEGRGTTTPFELIGAPFIDAERLAMELDSQLGRSVRVLPAWFRPTFDKWSGEVCGGVSLHVIEPAGFRSFPMTIQLLHAIHRRYPSEFAWLDPPYEYETERPPIDILFGSTRLRLNLGIEDPAVLAQAADHVEWYERTRDVLLYGAKDDRFRL